MATMEPTPTMADHLATSVRVTGQIVAGVPADRADDPTPCPDYEVHHLVDHLVGWATSFADRALGVTPPTDPASVSAGPDPAASYATQTARMLEGYGGSGPADGAVSVDVALIESVVHGWDLAMATGQSAPYPSPVLEAALAAGEAMLQPEYRGPGKSFGPQVEVPSSAPVLDRLVGFMGRDPGWKPPV